MTISPPLESDPADTLRQTVSVHHHDPAEAVAECGRRLVRRVRQAIDELGDQAGKSINLTGDQLVIRWALFPGLALLADSPLGDPHQVSLVARGFDGGGRALAKRNHCVHYDPWAEQVSSILLTGSDTFIVVASPTRSDRHIELARIPRTPGTEVLIDQTATVTDSDGRTWRVEHGVERASAERVAVVLRRFGPNGAPPAEQQRTVISYSHAFTGWPGGGQWWNLAVLGGPATVPIGPTSQLAGALLATDGDVDEAVRLVEQAATWRAWTGEQPALVPTRYGYDVAVQPDIYEPDVDPYDDGDPPPRWVDAIGIDTVPATQHSDAASGSGRR